MRERGRPSGGPSLILVACRNRYRSAIRTDLISRARLATGSRGSAGAPHSLNGTSRLQGGASLPASRGQRLLCSSTRIKEKPYYDSSSFGIRVFVPDSD